MFRVSKRQIYTRSFDDYYYFVSIPFSTYFLTRFWPTYRLWTCFAPCQRETYDFFRASSFLKKKKITFNFSSLSSSRTNEKLEENESQRRFIIQNFEKFVKWTKRGGRQRKNRKMNHCFVSFDPFNQNHNPAWGLRIPFQKPIDRPINRTASFFERKRLRGEESLKAWWREEGNELKEGQPGGETVIKITVGRVWVMTSSFASNHRSLINYLLLNYSSLNIPFMSAFHVLVSSRNRAASPRKWGTRGEGIS